MKYKDQRCDNCQFESLTATSHPCVGCRQGGEQGQPDELNWQPKITETVDLINTSGWNTGNITWNKTDPIEILAEEIIELKIQIAAINKKLGI